jgi:hypothetical protein
VGSDELFHLSFPQPFPSISDGQLLRLDPAHNLRWLLSLKAVSTYFPKLSCLYPVKTKKSPAITAPGFHKTVLFLITTETQPLFASFAGSAVGDGRSGGSGSELSSPARRLSPVDQTYQSGIIHEQFGKEEMSN